MQSSQRDTLGELLTLAIVLTAAGALALIVQIVMHAGWLIWRAW